MRKIIRQCYRGCGYLPHVGNHPGTGILWAMLLLGAIAGCRNINITIWWAGPLFGVVFMAIFILPIYLVGSYERAELSDKITLSRTDLEEK